MLQHWDNRHNPPCFCSFLLLKLYLLVCAVPMFPTFRRPRQEVCNSRSGKGHISKISSLKLRKSSITQISFLLFYIHKGPNYCHRIFGTDPHPLEIVLKQGFVVHINNLGQWNKVSRARSSKSYPVTQWILGQLALHEILLSKNWS